MHNIRIAILGPDSVGKSTFLNTILTNIYSEITDKKTANRPEIYYVNPELENVNAIEIYEKNKIANKKYDKKNIKPVHHEITMIKKTLENQNVHLGNFITLHNTITPVFYNLPGLNEKSLLKYTVETFSDFDIIFFVVDIDTCLTTTYEIKLLDTILSCIQDQKTTCEKEFLLYIIANKCDEMSDKHKEMLEHAENLVKKYAEDYNLDDLSIKIIPMSLETAYIYRMQKYNSEVPIDIKYINRFGTDMFGKINWNKMSETDKKNKLDGIFDDNNFNCMMESCNFTKLKNILESDLTLSMQFKLVINKYKQLITEICELNLVTCDEECLGNDDIQIGYFETVKKIIDDITKIITDLKKMGEHVSSDLSIFTNPIEKIIDILSIEYVSNKCHIYDHIGELYDSLRNYKSMINNDLNENLNNIIDTIKNHIITFYENGLENNGIKIDIAQDYILQLEKYVPEPCKYYEDILINNLNIYNSEPSQIVNYNEMTSKKCNIDLKSIAISQLYNLYSNLCSETITKYYDNINIPNYIYAIYNFWNYKIMDNKKIYSGYIFDEFFFIIYKLYINNKILLDVEYVPCELILEKYLCNLLESNMHSETQNNIKLVKNRIGYIKFSMKNSKKKEWNNDLEEFWLSSSEDNVSDSENSSEEFYKKGKHHSKKNKKN